MWTMASTVSDTWKMRSNLTVNLGLRYDIQWVPQPPRPNNSSALATYATSTLNIDKADIGPRIGVAWQISKDMVLRGGYGIFYGKTTNSSFYDTRVENGVFQQTFNCNANFNGPNVSSSAAASMCAGVPEYYLPGPRSTSRRAVCRRSNPGRDEYESHCGNHQLPRTGARLSRAHGERGEPCSGTRTPRRRQRFGNLFVHERAALAGMLRLEPGAPNFDHHLQRHCWSPEPGNNRYLAAFYFPAHYRQPHHQHLRKHRSQQLQRAHPDR